MLILFLYITGAAAGVVLKILVLEACQIRGQLYNSSKKEGLCKLKLHISASLTPLGGHLASGLYANIDIAALFLIGNLIRNTQICYEIHSVDIKYAVYLVAIAVKMLYKFQILQQSFSQIQILMPNIFFSVGLRK